MKFLVPNYSCLQNPWLGDYHPPDPRPLCPPSSTEFVELPPLEKNSGYATGCRGLQFWSHSRFSPAGRCLVSGQLRPYSELKDATVFISHALESLTPRSNCFRKPNTGCQLHSRLLGPVFGVYGVVTSKTCVLALKLILIFGCTFL